MKALARLVLLAFAIEIAAARLPAQDVVNHLNDPIAKARLFEFSTTLSKYAVDAPPDAAADSITTKHLRIGGPLVHPLKSKKLSELQGRLWHLVNPFAKTEAKPSIEPVAGLTLITVSRR